MMFSLPPISTPIDKPPSLPSLFSSLQSLAIATIVSTTLYCPNAIGKTLKARVTNTSFFLAGWACFSLGLRFIPLTQLVRKYLDLEVDTTIAFALGCDANLYRSHLLSEENRAKILNAAMQYEKIHPSPKKPEEPLFTTKKVLLGSIALCASTILLKESLRAITNEATAIHYVASYFFASAFLHPFTFQTIFQLTQLVQPSFANRIATLEDFDDDTHKLSVNEKRTRIKALAYGVQQVRENVIESAFTTEYQECENPPVHLDTKAYIAIALGVIGFVHRYYPFTGPKISLPLRKMSVLQNISNLLFNWYAYPEFSNAIDQVVSHII